MATKKVGAKAASPGNAQLQAVVAVVQKALQNETVREKLVGAPDAVLRWAGSVKEKRVVSSVVSPPDGDLTDFMASCARLRRDAWRVFHSGHGANLFIPRTGL